MRISSVVRSRWKMSSFVWWILYLLCSVLWISRILKHRYLCVIKWTVKSILVAMITGKKRNRLLSRLVRRRACLLRLSMEKLLSMVLSSTLWWKTLSVVVGSWVLSRLTTTCRNALNLNIWALIIRSIVRWWFTVLRSDQWNVLLLYWLSTLPVSSHCGWHRNR